MGFKSTASVDTASESGQRNECILSGDSKWFADPLILDGGCYEKVGRLDFRRDQPSALEGRRGTGCWK
jgi:hypothetical protein